MVREIAGASLKKAGAVDRENIRTPVVVAIEERYSPTVSGRYFLDVCDAWNRKSRSVL
jgi:hypothetical protein